MFWLPLFYLIRGVEFHASAVEFSILSCGNSDPESLDLNACEKTISFHRDEARGPAKYMAAGGELG